MQRAAKANTLENFRYVFVKALEGLFIDRMEQNEDICAKYMNDPAFKKLVSEHLLKRVYEQIREECDYITQTQHEVLYPLRYQRERTWPKRHVRSWDLEVLLTDHFSGVNHAQATRGAPQAPDTPDFSSRNFECG